MTATRVTEEPCDVCAESGSFTPYLTVSLVGSFDAEIFECRECGFRQIRPRLSAHELHALYADEYFDAGGDAGFKDYARQQQRYERQGYFHAKRLRRIAKTGRLLEVGCALGFLLESIRRHSDWEIEGIDVAPSAVEFARRKYGLNVRCTTLEEAGYPDNHFDYVIQKDVLEHVLRPRDHLAETRRIMRRGALLWLITPNGDANLKPGLLLAESLRASGKKRLPLLDQGHLSFFTRNNLLKLISDCGFDLVRFRNIGIRRGLRALGVLPRKRRARKTGPAGKPRKQGGPVESTSLPRADESDDELFERINTEVRRYHKPLRSWRPYYYYRQLLTSLDSLPAPMAWGNDFELTLRRK